MARLGKAERAAKRDLIARNMATPPERDYFQYRSSLNLDRVLGSTHMATAYGARGGMGKERVLTTGKARFSLS